MVDGPDRAWRNRAPGSRTQKHSEVGYGWPMDRGTWTAKTVKRPRQQPAHPQYANYWAPLTRKRHTMSHSAQPQHTNDGAPRTRKRHQQEHRPQRPTESSNRRNMRREERLTVQGPVRSNNPTECHTGGGLGAPKHLGGWVGKMGSRGLSVLAPEGLQEPGKCQNGCT